MSVVRLPDAARVSVAEAKRLLADAFPREDVMDVYVDADGEHHFKFEADANPQAFYLEHDFADTCEQLGIKPRFRLRPHITSYRGPEDDDLYVITRDELAALAGLFGIKVSTQDPAPALEQAPQAAEVERFMPRFERLTPRTPWAGGRMVDTDVLTLADAATMATKHAGEPVTIGDFLRAAARGEISLRAIVHHTAKVQAHDGGIFCNAGRENENKVPAGAIPTLPLTACQHLAAAGRASWRTFDGFETVNGGLQRYTAGQLVAGEPDFETVLEDCRVVGYDVHALADEYTAPETEQAEPVCALPATGESTTGLSKLATREALIDAFGAFTGMNASWFHNLTDTPRLLEARKVKGQGARGHTREPWFCPVEVMHWLIDPARRKGRPLSEHKGWELLEKHFPKAYNAVSAGDPRGD